MRKRPPSINRFNATSTDAAPLLSRPPHLQSAPSTSSRRPSSVPSCNPRRSPTTWCTPRCSPNCWQRLNRRSARRSRPSPHPPIPPTSRRQRQRRPTYGAAAAASGSSSGSGGISLSDVNTMVASAIQAAFSAIDHLTANTMTATNANLANATVTTLHVRAQQRSTPHLPPLPVAPASPPRPPTANSSWGKPTARMRSSLPHPRHPGRYRCMGCHHWHPLQSERSPKCTQCQAVACAVVRDDHLGTCRRQQSLLHERPRRARINATSSIGTLLAAPNLASVGTLTSGTWNAAAIGIPYGGTGLSSAPSYGQLLLGQSNGTYALVATTSSLGITGGAVAPAPSTLAHKASSRSTTQAVRRSPRPPASISHNPAISASAPPPPARFSITGSGTGATPDFVFADSNNAPRVVIQDNGNVGIGTAEPSAKLEAFKSGETTTQTTDVLRIGKSGTGAWGAGSGVGLVFSQAYNDGDQPEVFARIVSKMYSSGTDYSSLHFQTRIDGETSPTDKMIISGSGNVGIGTTSSCSHIRLGRNSAKCGHRNIFPGGGRRGSTFDVSEVECLFGWHRQRCGIILWCP